MDGVFEIVQPGQSFVYEFDAAPAGVQVYHCHAVPLKRHIHKGLYGMFIIDPPGGLEPAKEMVMVMNGFDTNYDGENEVYAVNTVAFHYQHHPIALERGQLNRVYLANFTEFDLINSFHLHGEFFRLYRTGSTDQFEYTDTVMLCQGERCVIEIDFHNPGRFMFHAHQSEFTELGWMGIFDVRNGVEAAD
jgi:FtsP/CotA-like multicopper oxidase with cupredoxin domain